MWEDLGQTRLQTSWYRSQTSIDKIYLLVAKEEIWATDNKLQVVGKALTDKRCTSFLSVTFIWKAKNLYLVLPKRQHGKNQKDSIIQCCLASDAVLPFPCWILLGFLHINK